MMALRAHYVPEELRATIINIFRIPLNLFVCVVLYKVRACAGGLGTHGVGAWGAKEEGRGLDGCMDGGSRALSWGGSVGLGAD